MEAVKRINAVFESMNIHQSMIVYDKCSKELKHQLLEDLVSQDFPVADIANYDEDAYRMYFCDVDHIFDYNLDKFNVVFCMNEDCYHYVCNNITGYTNKMCIYLI